MNTGHVLSLLCLCVVICHRSIAYEKSTEDQPGLTRKQQPRILYANKHDIRVFTAGAPGNETTLLGRLQGVVSVDFDWRTQQVFFTEIADLNEIRSFSLKKKKKQSKVVIDARTGRPSVIAVDWVTRKFYWTDDLRTRIELANFDGSHRKLLIDTDLDQPRALALLPQKGLMFWSDWGGRPMIQRANMDGTDHKPLVTKDIVWPNSLTIDMNTYTVYWADAKPDFTGIYSIDYNGRNRKTIFTHGKLRHPFSLTMFRDSLYWTDWKVPQINSCNNGTFHTIRDKVDSPMGLVVVAKERQPYVKTGCSENNGGCSHLCLLRMGGHSCACPTGIKLKEDRKTCESALEKFIVVARKPDIRIVSLDVEQYADVVLPLKGINNAFSVDYDIVEDYIYWSDNDKKSITRAHPNGTGVQVIADYDIHSPDGLAFDWIARNLYWTDAGLEDTSLYNRIEVARANGTSRKVLIETDLDEPRAIVVDPAEGYLYWTDWGTFAKIERAELDGSNRKILVNTTIAWPNGLAIDYVERKLYWGDAKFDQISCINLDGTDRQVILKDLPHVFGVSILGDDIYWTDWQRRKLSKANKHDKTEIQILKDEPDLMGIKAAERSLVYGNNPCQHNNNYCSHLCLFTPSGAKCSCPLGMELDKDEKRCIVPIGFLLIMQRGDIRRITLDIYKQDIVIPVAGVREAYALDFDLSEERIYWSDVATSYKDIKSAHVNGTGVKTIIRHGLERPVSISVDWIAKNIYWSDDTAHRIEVSRLDGRHRKVLLWEDIESPRAIAVNPHNGRIYWCSAPAYNGGDRIEQADLNGLNRKTVLENLGVVTSIALDYENELIYFAERLDHNIQRVDFQGNNRKILLTDVAYPCALTLYSSSIYFGDWKTRSVGSADKNTGKNRTRIMGNLEYVMDLLAYHKSRQTGTNSCANQNGHCSHLCFAQDEKNYTCGCPTHFSLRGDNKNCEAPASFLIFSQKNNIRRVTFAKKDNPDLVLPIPSKDDVKKIDYDFQSGLVYWIESGSNKIKAAFEDGSAVDEVVGKSEHPMNPYDIAVESYGGSIFWTDSSSDTIQFLHFKGNRVANVIFEKRIGYKPRNIVVSSEEGYLFWTNMVEKPTIEKSTLDGSKFFTLVDFRSGTPGDLAIDHVENRLYWIDTGKRKIESVHFSGQRRMSVVLDSLLNPRALTVFGDHVYWVDSDTEMVHMSNKRTGGMAIEVHGKFRRLTDIKAINRTRRSVAQPCAVNNGQCSHICTVSRAKSQSTEILTYEKKCACPVGYVLDSTSKLSCENQVKCTENQFRCRSDGSCIVKSKKCDKIHDCADGSDESHETCQPQCDIAIQFYCTIGCIAKHKQCDGKEDCPDGRDERNCPCSLPNRFKCENQRCIPLTKKCDAIDDCGDNSDETPKACSKSSGNSTTRPNSDSVTLSTTSPTKVLAGVVSGIVLSILILVFGFLLWWKNQRSKRGMQQATDIGLVAIPRIMKLGSEYSVDSAEDSKSSASTYMSDLHNSHRSELYNRNLTGTSNITLTSNYTPVPANPPPSVMTDNVLSTICENKAEPTRAPAPSMATFRSCSHCSLSSLGTLQNHKYNYMENGPPPPTPISTDAGKDSDYLYYSGLEMERPHPRRQTHRTHRSRSRRHRSHRMPRVGSPVSVDLTDDVELLPKQQLYRPNNMPWGFSRLHIDTDQDPFAPPPTPCTMYLSEYVSDEDSRPPSLADTERSIQQYPPPPSPTSQL